MEKHKQILIAGILCTIAVCSYLYYYHDKPDSTDDTETKEED